MVVHTLGSSYVSFVCAVSTHSKDYCKNCTPVSTYVQYYTTIEAHHLWEQLEYTHMYVCRLVLFVVVLLFVR